MKPPAHVSMVISPSIRIESLDDASRDAIAREGLELHRELFIYSAVHFEGASDGMPFSDSLVDALTRLNKAGILFSEDYKQGWAPADIMRELQSRNRITEAFTAIAWRGPGDWFTTVHEQTGKNL